MSSRTSFPEDGKMRISNVTIADSGQYSCHAFNKGGNDTRTFNLTINVPPTFTVLSNETQKTVSLNDDLSLSCASEGVPAPRVVWYKDSHMLLHGQHTFSFENGHGLKIIKANAADAGKYTCMAVNDAGIVEKDYFVSVLIPPVIDDMDIQGIDNDDEVVVNDTIRLHCNVQGFPTPNIVWYKNGFLVSNATSRFSLSGGGQYLDISDVHPTDDGSYACHAENSAGKAEQSYILHVSVPPEILENATVTQHKVLGHPVRIRCPATGNPLPSITWLKNGFPVVEDDHLKLLEDKYVLWLATALDSDQAEYTCIAFNNAGTKEHTFNLTILVPPSFENIEDMQLSVVQKQPLVMECVVKGNPLPDIVWLKDGLVVNNADTINVTNGVLHILETDIHHGGTYTCEASNVAGKSNQEFYVSVFVPPVISDNDVPSFLTSVVGESVTMACYGTGIPTPTIMWFKNNQPILSDYKLNVRVRNQGRELVLHQLKRSDSSSYQCRASNVAGNTSKSFVLTVLEPPKITKISDNMKVIVGSEVSVECRASGFPQPKVSWLLDGTPFARNTLYLVDDNIQDSVEYTCIATNEAGTANASVYFDVLVPPSIVRTDLVMKVITGDSITLPCERSGHPFPTVMWHKDSIVIQNNKERNVLSDGSLHIPTSAPSMAGTYTCVVENEVGLVEATRDLRVLSSPKIANTFLEEYFTVLGQRVMLECAARGVPSPVIGWEKNGYSVDDSDPRIKLLTKGTLQIMFTQSSDMGTYTCIAKNEAGDDSRNAKLVVWVPPSIVKDGESSLLTVKGRTVELPCRADGFPLPEVTWQQSGDLPPANSKITPDGSLIISDVQAEDSGNYVCVATNPAGRDYHSISLQVNIPPTITVVPRSHDISVGDSLSLLCEAMGIPIPTIKWLLNNTEIKGHISSPYGRSQMQINKAGRLDEGTYSCIAQNSAGERKAIAAVRVRMPPIILDSFGIRRAHLQDAVMLDCAVDGDPQPDIIWLKNGQQVELNHRIQQKQNGSLVIYNSLDQDSGQYKCIARNSYGSAEAVSELVIRSPPNFVIEPRNLVTELGNSVSLDCKVVGEPKPDVKWKKDNVTLAETGRSYVFTNNTLRIVAVQLSDEGSYTCLANNTLGSVQKIAQLTIKVNGMWAAWGHWNPCSVTCGDGIQHRERFCTNPSPRNGGKDCIGFSLEAKTCGEDPCPVDGEWSNWQPWESCSTTCGIGQRRRQRVCNNPPLQYGGQDCVGNSSDVASCLLRKCPVDGMWTPWSLWLPCTVSCGTGTQMRMRECADPSPEHGGLPCSGEHTEQQECKIKECEVHGNWGTWSKWSFCSTSCGGGTQERVRVCDNPAPDFGGRYCTGSSSQLNYCNSNQCPVHGEWAPWSLWGECSSSCNKGQRKRFRTCSDPQPSGGGRECIGSTEQMDACNTFPCPVDGKWTEWSSWSSCSVSCGFGKWTRKRSCENPVPKYSGKDCIGENKQQEQCTLGVCDTSPTHAIGHLIGSINGHEIGPSKIISNISTIGAEKMVTATINNIPIEIVPWLKLLVPLLTPIYWTTAFEIGDVSNGYTLTKGYFNRETEVDFGTGDVLYMSHVAHGVDSKRKLLVDTVVSGEVPKEFSHGDVVLHPYSEEYLQLGPGSIYAFSTRSYNVDEFVLPYFWNHTISYSATKGKMPYMIQKLYADGIKSHYNVQRQEMNFVILAAISKGDNDEECPEGFDADLVEKYCRDEDECTINAPCSHLCSNYPGGYSCYCPGGLALDADGHTCIDIDECDGKITNCTSVQECVNTIGSYECIVICETGFQRTTDNLFCQDIDECTLDDGLCNHDCVNTMGSYYCTCDEGYRLEDTFCVDIDECHSGESPCSHLCLNIPGSFMCTCPDGYQLSDDRNCKDIDECASGIQLCPYGHICENTEGSYECFKPCVDGLIYSSNGSCIDIDECRDRTSSCHSTQICRNTFGSYVCTCSTGFVSTGVGRPCKDINECKIRGMCQHLCQDTWGSYRCICPVGYKLGISGKTCEDIDECTEENISCGVDKTCFNMKGSFECVDTPCPPNYERDPVTGICGLPCEKSQIICPRGMKYADFLAYKMVALASGVRAYQDLLELATYDQNGIPMPNTLFSIIENRSGVPFRISLEHGRGTLYSQRDMDSNREYKIKVKAVSYDLDNQTVLYTTKFVVFISVSKYPY